ncbi:MAG: hypothetical protein M1837_001380 [Sclerophora amabilis]|nr:MAG: hypothetical protein M1837_001380 [Sclerophora amabilis]
MDHRSSQAPPDSTTSGPTPSTTAPSQSQDRSASFNMTAMTSSLPHYPAGPQFAPPQQHALPPHLSPSSMLYQLPHTPSYPGQASFQYQQNPMLHAQYAQPYHPYYQPSHQPANPNQALQGFPPQFSNPYATLSHQGPHQMNFAGSSWVPSHHHQQQQQPPPPQHLNPVFYPRATFGQVHQPFPVRSAGPYGVPAQRRLSLPLHQSQNRFQESGSESSNAPRGGSAIADFPYGLGPNVPYVRPGSVPGKNLTDIGRHFAASDGSLNPSMPRGPPRKPRQSGHALWVGNLPPGTRVIELKDHFSKDATTDIESVFLISKSNCAFVNYRSEPACAAAMSRFHDSRFQGVRLVCRLRRNSANPSPVAPTGPASLALPVATEASAAQRQESQEGGSHVATDEPSGEKKSSSVQESAQGSKDKFFVVKSLTMEDLETSVRNGIWATQSHNEATLNRAYETTDNVYLIFSANKSGEYFGYARMASAIDEDSSAAIDWAPRAQIPEETDLPKAIPTVATEFAPKGRIIDDSARGTIFWEADAPDEGSEDRADDDRSSDRGDETEAEDGSSFSKAWGNPFKIEWKSTSRLPFYRTRGLRNPWNANREVKIARDGTELETSVGRRLLQMFHRTVPSPVGPSGESPSMPGFGQQSRMGLPSPY